MLVCRKLLPAQSALGGIFSSDAAIVRLELAKRTQEAERTLPRARADLLAMRLALLATRNRFDALDYGQLESEWCIELRSMEESNGSDVHFRVRIAVALPGQQLLYSNHRRLFDVWVEVKPYMSDDYPSVLRQLKIQKKLATTSANYETKFVAVVGTYGGQGASLPQVRQIFGESGFDLVLMNEIGCEIPSVANVREPTETLPLFAS